MYELFRIDTETGSVNTEWRSVHAQIGVGYVRAPDTERTDVIGPPPVGLSQLVTTIMKMASTLPVSSNNRGR